MKRKELKSILKPLIKECVKEVIFEDGVLSGIITEVVRGTSSLAIPTARTQISEGKSDPGAERIRRNAFEKQHNDKLKEHKEKLMSAIGQKTYNGVNLFEGTLPSVGEATPQEQSGPLANIDPGDPGVDIGNILGRVGHNWNVHMSDIKEGK